MANREDIALHTAPGSIGVELGVASGQFSARLLETGRFSVLYSIDAWSDHHDLAEFSRARSALARFGDRSIIIRARFEDAVQRFRDGFFDFIYIDGYAHTGQEDGQTLRDWWPKVKPGGILSGDDYSPSWPHTVKAVDDFVAEHDLPLWVHTFEGGHKTWDQCPSWVVMKP